MEIRQLEIFLSVAKMSSFSKAAEELFVSQPTVSAQINSLEKTLGVQLFIRNAKVVTLTKAGIDFMVYAKKILTLRDQAVFCASGEDRSISGSIDIISSTIPAQHLLPDIIASFKKSWHNISFRVKQSDSSRVAAEMSGFRFDFGMVGTIPDDDRFVCTPVYDDELVLITPNDIAQESGSVHEPFQELILKTPFIMRESGSGTRAEIESLLKKIGVMPENLQVPAFFSDAHSILLAVSRGMGISLVSKVAAAMYVEAGMLTAIEMNDPLFHRQIYLIHNKELSLSPALHAFADHAKTFFKKS